MLEFDLDEDSLSFSTEGMPNAARAALEEALTLAYRMEVAGHWTGAEPPGDVKVRIDDDGRMRADGERIRGHVATSVVSLAAHLVEDETLAAALREGLAPEGLNPGSILEAAHRGELSDLAVGPEEVGLIYLRREGTTGSLSMHFAREDFHYLAHHLPFIHLAQGPLDEQWRSAVREPIARVSDEFGQVDAADLGGDVEKTRLFDSSSRSRAVAKALLPAALAPIPEEETVADLWERVLDRFTTSPGGSVASFGQRELRFKAEPSDPLTHPISDHLIVVDAGEETDTRAPVWRFIAIEDYFEPSPSAKEIETALVMVDRYREVVSARLADEYPLALIDRLPPLWTLFRKALEEGLPSARRMRGSLDNAPILHDSSLTLVDIEPPGETNEWRCYEAGDWTILFRIDVGRDGAQSNAVFISPTSDEGMTPILLSEPGVTSAAEDVATADGDEGAWRLVATSLGEALIQAGLDEEIRIEREGRGASDVPLHDWLRFGESEFGADGVPVLDPQLQGGMVSDSPYDHLQFVPVPREARRRKAVADYHHFIREMIDPDFAAPS